MMVVSVHIHVHVAYESHTCKLSGYSSCGSSKKPCMGLTPNTSFLIKV